jgi:hypothetical protein
MSGSQWRDSVLRIGEREPIITKESGKARGDAGQD